MDIPGDENSMLDSLPRRHSFDLSRTTLIQAIPTIYFQVAHTRLDRIAEEMKRTRKFFIDERQREFEAKDKVL